MLSALKALAKELGGTPTHNDVAEASRKDRSAHPSAIAAKFGSFNNAIRAAKLMPTRQRLPVSSYSRQGLIRHLRALKKELKRVPTTRDLVAARKAGKCPGPNAVIKVFGSQDTAFKAAGIL